MGRQHCCVIVAACLLSVFALCVGQAPVDICEEDFSDNLSCEGKDEKRRCSFPRSELCNKETFCADGSDEGVTTGTGLDCEICMKCV